MKKLFLFAVLITAFYSCGGGSTATTEKGNTPEIPTDIDYNLLADEAEFKKLYDIAVAKLDTNVNSLLKFDISISRPSESIIKIANSSPSKDKLTVRIQYVHPTDRNKLCETNFKAETGKWSNVETKTVRLIIGDAETFRLEDNAMKLSSYPAEKLFAFMQKTFTKYKNDEKYQYFYIKSVSVEQGKTDVNVCGRLKANDLIKTEFESTRRL